MKLYGESLAKAGAHLLSQEVTDLYRLPIFLNNAVDGEVRVNRAHFVTETLYTRSAKHIN